MNPIRLTTKDPAKKKEVFCGMIEDNTYTRSVNNEHYMVKEGGYGIQVDVMTKLVKYGVKNVLLTTQKGTKLFSNLTDWVKHGHKKDYGNGEQLFLNTKFMRETKGGAF